MKSRVTERGQVTVPKELRERLGIRPGQTLEFHEEGGRIVITKSAPRAPLDTWFGVLVDMPPTDDLMESLRGRVDSV